MRAARDARRPVVGVVACAVLAAGCVSHVAGTGTYAAGAGPPTTTPAAEPTTPPASAPVAPTSTAVPAPSAPPSSVPAVFAGTWTGQANQPGSVLPRWNAVLVLTEGRPLGTFTVVGFCSGVIAVHTADQTRLVGREIITSDPQNTCAASGTLTVLRTGPDRANLRWVDDTHADNVATAILTRS
jgi:hypothetical protein